MNDLQIECEFCGIKYFVHKEYCPKCKQEPSMPDEFWEDMREVDDYIQMGSEFGDEALIN